MPQEFLASFAVDIDESGVNRLQSILSQNRDLAAGLAAAFDNARSSMMSFIQAATEELSSLPFFSPGSSVEESFGTSGAFSIDLDFSKATKQLEAFMSGVKKQMRLSADASGIVSAASSALAQVRSMLAGANLTLNVKVEKNGEIPGASGAAGSAAPPRASGAVSSVPSLQLATGGRFSSPTKAEIAEDGDPEYVVPVRKENEAVPLVRSLLSELSASARASLGDILSPNTSGVILSEAQRSRRISSAVSGSLSSIPDIMTSAAALSSPVIRQFNSNNVSAPVNIHVETAAADPEAVGRSIYDTAERYLLRTMQSAV